MSGTEVLHHIASNEGVPEERNMIRRCTKSDGTMFCMIGASVMSCRTTWHRTWQVRTIGHRTMHDMVWFCCCSMWYRTMGSGTISFARQYYGVAKSFRTIGRTIIGKNGDGFVPLEHAVAYDIV
jgi:hypothetical protein